MLTPRDLEEYIRRAGIAAEVLPMEVETPTVPAAAAAVGVEPGQIIKTLVFRVRGEPVVVIASGATTVDHRALARRFGVGKKQVKLADAETVLRVTGYPVGGVPPLGHTRAREAPVFLDMAMREWDVVYGGGGDDRTLLRIAVAELSRAISGEWMELGSAEPAAL